jgi:hypothetical protein
LAACSASTRSSSPIALSNITVRGRDEGARPRQRHVDPEPWPDAAALLEACERGPRAVELSERHQRLDVERLAPIRERFHDRDRLQPLAHVRQGPIRGRTV